MKDILRKLKLIDSFTIKLELSRAEFVNNLQNITDKGHIGMFSDSLDAFSSSKKELKGHIDYNGFKIKKRRRFLENNFHMATASGTISESEGNLQIETEISGFNNFILMFYIFLIVFYSILIFNVWNFDNNSDFFPTSLLIFHGTLMFSIPYFMMRRSVKRLKYELEREFFYLTKKSE